MEDNKIGYEIPFTREFYKYVAPKSGDEIFANLQKLDEVESLMAGTGMEEHYFEQSAPANAVGDVPQPSEPVTRIMLQIRMCR